MVPAPAGIEPSVGRGPRAPALPVATATRATGRSVDHERPIHEPGPGGHVRQIREPAQRSRYGRGVHRPSTEFWRTLGRRLRCSLGWAVCTGAVRRAPPCVGFSVLQTAGAGDDLHRPRSRGSRRARGSAVGPRFSTRISKPWRLHHAPQDATIARPRGSICIQLNAVPIRLVVAGVEAEAVVQEVPRIASCRSSRNSDAGSTPVISR